MKKYVKYLYVFIIFLIIGISLYFAKYANAAETIYLYDYVFFNPVTNQSCNQNNYWTPYNTNTNCHRWFVIEIDGSTLRLLLDHNYVHLDAAGNENGICKYSMTYDQTSTCFNQMKKDWPNVTASRLGSSATFGLMRFDKTKALTALKNGTELKWNYSGSTIYLPGMFPNMFKYKNGKINNIKGYWIVPTDSTVAPPSGKAYYYTRNGSIMMTNNNDTNIGLRPTIYVSNTKVDKMHIRNMASSDVTSTFKLVVNGYEVANNNAAYKKRATNSDGNGKYTAQGFSAKGNNYCIYLGRSSSDSAEKRKPGYMWCGTTKTGAGTLTSNRNYGHGNDMTHNGSAYAVTNNSSGTYKYTYGTSVTAADKNTLNISESGSANQFTYDYDHNYYYAGSNFRLSLHQADGVGERLRISTATAQTPIPQGVEYHRGYLYKSYYAPVKASTALAASGYQLKNECKTQLYCNHDQYGHSTGFVYVYNAKLNKNGQPSIGYGKLITMFYTNFYNQLSSTSGRISSEIEGVSFSSQTNEIMYMNAAAQQGNDSNKGNYLKVYSVDLTDMKTGNGNFYYATTVNYYDTKTTAEGSEKYYFNDILDTNYFGLGDAQLGWIYSSSGGGTSIADTYKKVNSSISTSVSTSKNGITVNLKTVKITSSKYSNIGSIVTNGGSITVAESDIDSFLKQFTCTRCTVVVTENGTEKYGGNFVNGKTYKLRIKANDTNKTTINNINLTPTIKEYNITYNLNGGTVGWNPTIYKTDTATFTLNNPSKTGYDFTGWTGTGLSSATKTVTIPTGSKGNRSYTANWVAATYNINYNSNGGQSGPASQSYIYSPNASDKTRLSATVPTRAGYTFLGWSTSSTATTATYTAGGEFPRNIADNTTLFAVWRLSKLTVNYNVNGGTIADQPHLSDTTYFKVVNNLVNSSSSANGTYAVTTGVINSNGTYLNLWNVGTYNATKTGYHINGTEAYRAKNATNGALINQDTTATTSTNAATPYRLNNNANVTADTTATLYINWIPNQYTIGYTLNGGTHGSSHPTSASYDANVLISNPTKKVEVRGDANSSGATIGAATNVNQTFTGWTSTTYQSNAKTGTTTNPTTTWTGTSTKNTYFKNLRNDTGTVTMVANWATAPLNLPTVTKTGATCAWYSTSGTSGGTKIGNSGASYTPAANSATPINVYARCTANTYTVTYNGNGATSGSTANSTHTYGTAKNLTANGFSRTGYTFAGWATSSSGNKVYDNQASVTNLATSGTVTLYAKWTPVKYNIGYTLNGGIHGSSHPTEANYDTDVIISNPTKKVTVTGNANNTGATIGAATSGAQTFSGWTSTTYQSNAKTGTAANPGTAWSGASTKNTYFRNLRNDTGTVTMVANWTPVAFNLPTVTKTGHTCKWNTAANGSGTSYNSGASYTPTANSAASITMYAVCTANNYTLTYSGNGGSVSTNSKTLAYGAAYGELPTATRAGYTLKGWYTASSGGSQVSASTTMGGANTTIYAQWTAVPYTITYNLNGGEGTNPASYSSDTNTFTLNNPTKEGYTFRGWTGSNGSTPQTSVTIAKGSTGNKSYTANWAPTNYTITYDLDGGVATNPSSYTIETNSFTLNNPTKAGHTFKGWTGSNGGVPQTNVVIAKGTTGNKSYTANWEKNKYNVTFNTNGGSTVAKQEVEYNSKATKPADPTKAGNSFAGWYKNSSLTEEYDFNAAVTGNITLYAKWEAGEYTITFNTNGGSSINPITKKYGETVTAPENPKKEYHQFAGWFVDEALTALYTFDKMGSSDITLYAKWIETGNVITYVLDGGINNSQNPTVYEAGEEKELHEATKEGHTFKGWYSDAEYSNKIESITADMDGDITLYAKFEINSYMLRANANGGAILNTEGWTVTDDKATKSVAYKAAYGELPEATKEGYEFKGWYTEIAGGSKVSSSTKIDASDTSIYAHWEEENYQIVYNLEGGTVINPTTYNVNTNAFTLNNPTKTGYRFTGWTGSNGTIPQTSVTIEKGSTGNREYTANYEKETYTISYSLDGGEAVGNPSTYYIDTETFTLNNPTKEGATFTGWTGSNGSEEQKEVTIEKGSMGDRSYIANWKNNKYIVEFDTNGGSSISEQEIEHKGRAVRPSDPEKEGYRFTGWYTNSTLTEEYDFNTAVTKNMTLYAKWEAKEYTITFDTNGGSSVSPITKKYGESVSAPESPVKEGYKFAGWYIDEGLTTLYTFDKMDKENITLYAKWTENENVISYELDGGVNNSQNPTTYLTGEEKTLYDAEKEGYDFLGWYSDSNYTNKIEGITSDMNKDITLYARFKEKEYTITFNSNGGSSVPSITKKYNETVEEPENPTKEGYLFKGWYSDPALTEKYTFDKMGDKNITLYAKWISSTVIVSFNTNGGEPLENLRVERGEELTSLPTPERLGYSFVDWYKNSTLTEKYNGEAIEEDTTLYAKWKINKYTVRFINDGEVVKEETKEYGETVDKIESPTKRGYEFKGWYKDSIGVTPYDFEEEVTSDIDLYAGWEAKEYTINFNTNGGSSINPITKKYEETVEEPEEPSKDGYRFAGWYSDEELTSLYSFTTMPDKNITLYAKWINKGHLVMYELDGGINNEENPTSYEEGDVINLKDPVREGYTFKGWYTSDLYTTKVEQITKDMKEDLTLYAKWQVNKIKVTFKTDEEEIEVETERESTPSVPELEKEGHSLDGWYKDKDLSIRYNGESINEDTTLYGKWIKNTYTIYFDTNGGSPINSISGLYGDEVERPNDPLKEGYKFAGWYRDPDLTELYSFTTFKENITLYAKWAKNDDSIIDYDPEGGENDPSNPTIIDPDKPAPIKPAEKEGTEFIRWETEDGRVITDTSQLKGNEKLYAVYKDGRFVLIPDTASFITISGIVLGTMLIGSGIYLVYKRYKEYIE